jgi:LmbE family N-acetylglucosaminyl deacetylase
MSQRLQLRDSDRLLIVVPHPDDETLATGGLIQVALEAGAEVRVLIATDGDNNPWPQRWLERRWRIDADARARWGARRREEARAALTIAGLPDASIRYFGWPDQGVTDRVMEGDGSRDRLVAEINDFAPNMVVAPVLFDRHPDHSALRVLLELALAKTAYMDCRRLGFVVHGSVLDGGSIAVPIAAIQQQTKQRALYAHATQTRLSEKRLLDISARTEHFESVAAPEAHTIDTGACVLHIRWPARRRWLHRHDLLLVYETTTSVVRMRVRLPRLARSRNSLVHLPDGQEMRISARADGDEVELALSNREPILRGYAKVERCGTRLVIYDADGWHDMRDWIV